MNELSRRQDAGVKELRDSAMERLVHGYSRDLITMEEFERRSSAMARAADRSELESLVADLPQPEPAAAPRRNAAPATTANTDGEWRISDIEPQASDLSVCVFSGVNKKGAWRVPRVLKAICVFGGANLDLRQAIVPPEGFSIKSISVFGGVNIIAPPGIRIEVRGIGIMGGFNRTGSERDNPGAPLLCIEGVAVFGGVNVIVKD